MVQHDLQDTMQDLVGIVRTESEMREALARIAALNERAGARRRRRATASTTPAGTPASTCATCSTVSEAIARSAIERKESRGGHFREDFPDKAAEFGTFNHHHPAAPPTARCRLGRVPLPEMPARAEAGGRGAEDIDGG